MQDPTGGGPWRLDIPIVALGLRPPPWVVRVIPQGPFEIVAQTLPGRAPAVAAWLQAHGDAQARCDQGVDARRATLHVDGLPAPLRWMLQCIDVDALEIAPAGIGTAIVRGPRAQIDAVIGALAGESLAIGCRPVMDDELSRIQQEALHMAVAWGYYEVPRRIDLRSLAARLGMSHGALSETLRRAERAVVGAFCDAALVQTKAAKTLTVQTTQA